MSSGRPQGLSRSWLKSRAGQAFVFMAFMIVALIGGVGMGIDASVGYYWSTAAERAAAAGALSGVIFMPDQLLHASSISPCTRCDAEDRARDEAGKNGFVDGANGATVAVAAVAGADNKLRVTATTTVRTFFMGVFGLSSYVVSHDAIASYLPDLAVGQPGGQIGSAVSELGKTAFYFMRMEGWSTDRGHGDAYTPDPAGGAAGVSNDVHTISVTAGTDSSDALLTDRGGYNFAVTVPAGATGQIQVYNAAFAPDGGNTCDNWKPAAPAVHCSAGSTYNMHENDSFACAQYSSMAYTIYEMKSKFIRTTDVKRSQLIVQPVDASNWRDNTGTNGTPTYTNIATAAGIDQTYFTSGPNIGAPSNMLIYHEWIDVGRYTATGAESNLLIRNLALPAAGLGPGKYRLRVDMLEPDGTYNATSPSCAHKGFAVRVRDGANAANPCAPACSLSAMNEMSIYTPINTPTGSATPLSFPVSLFQMPPDYAGKTVSVDIFDAGDAGGGSVYMGIVDPRTNTLLGSSPQPSNNGTVSNLGVQRSNLGVSDTPLATTTPGVIETVVNANQAGAYAGCAGCPGDNNWIHFHFQVPVTYTTAARPGGAGPDPNFWWWNLQYRTTSGVQAGDTVTIAVHLKGNPAHLVTS